MIWILAIIILIPIIILSAAQIKKNKLKKKLENMVRKISPKNFPVIICKGNPYNALAYEMNGKQVIAVDITLCELLNEEELYFVLAHEASHHLKNHMIIRAIVENGGDIIFEWMRPKTLWEKIGLPFLGKGEAPWWQKALQIVGSFAKAKLYQKEEKEADEKALEMLHNYGLPLKGSLTFFEKISKLPYSYFEFYEKLFGSHPLPKERKKNIELKLNDIKKTSINGT